MFITDSLVNIEITGSDRRVDYSHILSASEDTTPVAADARSGLPAKLVTPVVTPPTTNRQRNPAEKIPSTNIISNHTFVFRKCIFK